MADNIWTKLYSRINWKNRPSKQTPINETNLGKIDYAVDELDNRVLVLNTDVGNLQTETENLNDNLIEQKMLGWTVPSECPIQNEVSGNQFIQKVGRFDLGNLNWSIINGCFYSGKNIFKQYEIDVMPNIFTRKYTTITTRWVSTYNKAVDKVVSLQPAETNQLWFYDSAYTTINTFKESLLGQYLYYELPTPITMTIDGNEVTERINDSLADYGLDNKCTEIFSGNFNLSTGEYETNNLYVRTGKIPCKENDTIVTRHESTFSAIYIAFYGASGHISSDAYSDNMVVPSGATSFVIDYNYDSETTPQSVGNISVYVNNEIEQLKNDLGGLTFSASGTTLSITDGTNTWTLEAN